MLLFSQSIKVKTKIKEAKNFYFIDKIFIYFNVIYLYLNKEKKFNLIKICNYIIRGLDIKQKEI